MSNNDALGIIFYAVRNDSEEPMLNRVAACVTGGKVSHVEVRFPDGLSCGIYNEETVFMKRRSYSNPQYLQCE
tara:strand:+ start:341 stop:559 length:219 start_codon:yes stop_codon:yes gene_type:complete